MPDTTPDLPAVGPDRVTVWNRPDRGTRGPRPEHSRAEIAATGIALADAGGLSAVSMRAVAGALGTVAGSLYRYLSSRDDLLNLMVDAALGELPLERESTGNWLDDLVAPGRRPTRALPPPPLVARGGPARWCLRARMPPTISSAACG